LRLGQQTQVTDRHDPLRPHVTEVGFVREGSGQAVDGTTPHSCFSRIRYEVPAQREQQSNSQVAVFGSRLFQDGCVGRDGIPAVSESSRSIRQPNTGEMPILMVKQS
jgi:hypothetical protein